MEETIILTNFVFLNTFTSYNTILGRPWIHKMRVFSSSYHQLMKHPIVDEVKEIKKDHERAKSCNNLAMKNTDSISSSK